MLIPFGMKDKKLFDISEVVKGRACDCICPSCKQPLRANKGDPEKKIHHFSHDPKSQKEGETRKDCEYSFFVAARLLIKQRFEEMESLELLLPDGVSYISQKDIVGETHTKPCEFAVSKTVRLDHIEIEKKHLGTELDAVGYCGGYGLGIHFSYDGRLPLDLAQSHRDKAIVDIDLTELRYIYQELKLEKDTTFIDIVLDYAQHSGDRSWLYHPRQVLREEESQSQLNIYIEKYNRWLFRKDGNGHDVYEQYYGQGGHYCQICKRAWLDDVSEPKCPECDRSGRTFGRRAEIRTFKDLVRLRNEKICLKFFSCKTDEFEDICSDCYQAYRSIGIKSLDEITRSIIRKYY
ncbi:hypothetical protein [Vibrio sp. 99-70-13A1]|uniref:hypothetical protein n=1 Tax=Vibrio sp. 99-70-13A1 TaxID=2607601 RepID=UPI0014934B25|nr:hypothetical protein [Vibrio sp. 99-70-13A1]NOH99261.1 hypothetical protein [Vibrio sp. 99-70-13A1]